jgi:hypothetical protein
MPDVQEVFRLSTQKVTPDPGALERQHTRQRRRSTGRKLGALAVAAAIGLAALVVILETRPWEHTTIPANPSPTITPDDASSTAVAVATSFLQAYGAFDADTALGYVADDGDISGLIGTDAVSEEKYPDQFRLLVDWLEAEGYKQIQGPCEITGLPASGTALYCPFDYQAIRSDTIGRRPYHGSYFELTVRDGKIVDASLYWETVRFSPQVWEPFATWVSTNHPEDVAVMYEDATLSNYRLSTASVLLWEQRSREWAKEVRRSQGR